MIQNLPVENANQARGKLLAEVKLLRDNKQFSPAHDLLSMAVLRDPQDNDMLYELAMLDEKLNRLDDMEQRLRELIRRQFGHTLSLSSVSRIMSLLGITLGHHIPPEWGLGFAGTVALLAMTYSMLADRATWLPALVAGAAAVAAYALPLKLNMLVAIAAAVAVGTIIDHARPAAGAAR